MTEQSKSPNVNGKRRRWLLGLEPFFEAGREGKRAAEWNVEDELVAVAFLGDVTIDLSKASIEGREIAISAWAIFRDVEVIVSKDFLVEVSGSVVWGNLEATVPPASSTPTSAVVRIRGHALIGDVAVRYPNKLV
jgi:predicted membrane protein